MNTVKASVKSKIIFLTVFSIAMGLFEAVVVIYLRELYYPEGFSFPLKIMPLEILSIEYFREISTLIMLFSVAVIAGRSFYERFSYFLLCFGIWDIFYYVWLKIFLNWPQSLLTWDILFLIPIVWVGPVLAPVICAITMIVIAMSILYFQKKGYKIGIKLFEWMLLLLGAFIIFISFIWEYTEIIIKGGFISKIASLHKDKLFQKIIITHIPTSFNWYLFLIGECFILISVIINIRRLLKDKKFLKYY